MTASTELSRVLHSGRRHLALTAPEQEALSFLLPLSEDYPNFEAWFRTRVVPGLRADTRNLIRVERAGALVAVGIAKREEAERKICTVRVAQSHFGRGLGLRIFDTCLRWLETDKPHLTISERKLSAFQRIFESYGFVQTSAEPSRYVERVTEFGYN
jgi:Acetyltransferase (GNAT) domain